jgi:hypothetical protein
MVALVALAAGCAPRTADPSSGSGSEDTTATVAWSMQSDCATCHLAETNEQDPTAPATVHEQEGTTCITCHADEEKMTAVHEGATADLPMPTRLKKTEVDPTLCGSCHEADELATLTVASTVITDTEGTVVNPHDIPDNSSHNSITCINCHQVHEPAASLPDNSLNTCFNCHHEKVLQCGTCHD